MQEEKQLETTGRLKEIEIEVKYLEKESVRNFVRLGQLLNEARTIFNTSFAGISFDEWCRNVFGYSRTTITYFSQIANRWGNDYPKEFGSFTKLIEVIKLNDADIEDIINKEHLIAGESKKATDLTREELRQIIKEKKELQKALEQKDKDIKVLEAKTEETIQQELERRMADKQLEILQRKKEINEEVNKLNK